MTYLPVAVPHFVGDGSGLALGHAERVVLPARLRDQIVDGRWWLLFTFSAHSELLQLPCFDNRQHKSLLLKLFCKDRYKIIWLVKQRRAPLLGCVLRRRQDHGHRIAIMSATSNGGITWTPKARKKYLPLFCIVSRELYVQPCHCHPQGFKSLIHFGGIDVKITRLKLVLNVRLTAGKDKCDEETRRQSKVKIHF